MTKEELEKEAEEWLCNNLHSASEEDFIKAMVDFAEPREKQIRALQKQNGELSEKLKDLRESIKDYGAGCYENGLRNGKRKLAEQLTKAKELIKDLLGSENTSCEEEMFLEIRQKAEQFLKGEFTTELSNECQDCTKFDEMPNGPRCKTCDNGSHFQKKEEA